MDKIITDKVDKKSRIEKEPELKVNKKTLSKLSSKVFRADTKQTLLLKSAGRNSSKRAIRESKALGLNITFMQNGILYQENAEGIKQPIGKKVVKATKGNNTTLKLKEGMVFHAKD